VRGSRSRKFTPNGCPVWMTDGSPDRAIRRDYLAVLPPASEIGPVLARSAMANRRSRRRCSEALEVAIQAGPFWLL
jgi:hypothetical protein